MHAVSSQALFEYGFEKSPQNSDSVILTRVKQLFGKILIKVWVFFLTFCFELFYCYEKAVLKEREVKSRLCCH